MRKNISLDSIRTEVQENIGKDVILVADKGRKRIVTSKGVIVEAFPSIFTVKIYNEYDIERMVSYTYSDILTSTVELKLC